jgi:cyclopropane-fatty-acyl-phospholipid synthase
LPSNSGTDAAWGPDPAEFCRFTWRIQRASALRALLRSDRQVALGGAYVDGDFDLTGDFLGIFGLAEHLEQKHLAPATKLRLRALLFSLPTIAWEPGRELRGRCHSQVQDREAVGFRYEMCNNFYELWLDPRLIYSCAYFETPQDSLEAAQARKLDYICRKLRLRPGERLLDMGCGWGDLILHAAQHHGVEATGISLSPKQVVLAQQRIMKAGLAERCRVQVLDYRDAGKLGQFDTLVSVGVVEHGGQEKLPEYFRIAFELLKPRGVFLHQGIGRAAEPAQPTFTDLNVFPDGELVPIATMLQRAEEAGFEVRDVENLREHYFLTLCHWLRGLESNEARAVKLIGELKYRTWRLYLAGSAHYFQSGKVDLYQLLLTKLQARPTGLPLTPQDWYRS